MKIKKYIASTMPEAMNQIRKDLGPEAVILNSKEIQQGGFLGLFKKKKIEVIAALDPEPIKHKTAAKKITPIREKNIDQEVLKEIKQLKDIVKKQSFSINENYPFEYQLLYQHLLDQEVEQEIAENIMNTVVDKHKKEETEANIGLMKKDTKAVILAFLKDISFQGISDEEKIIQFVGPTGVGKTTTLAKVAANLMLQNKKKVAFITSDTYRIAAVEQLKTYARILHVPIEVVYSLDDLKVAIEKLDRYDHILIDTAGRNFREAKYVKDLQQLRIPSMSTYLVLSSTAKAKDLEEIYEQFSQIPIHQLLFTKIDETSMYGSILNFTVKYKKGIAYMTNGQDVPNDIIEASAEKIAELVVGGFHDE